MPAPGSLRLHASTDSDDQLLAADEPLATLHHRSGGELPGPIVTPGLLALVRKARQTGLRVKRSVYAQDDREQVAMWAEVAPSPTGCDILITNWRAEPLPGGDGAIEQANRLALARLAGEVSAMLGKRQELLSVECVTAELAALIIAMRAGLGRPWTDFVELQKIAYRQPMHWRLLDGAKVRLAGSAREFTVHIFPLGQCEPEATGFELHLLADQPPPPLPPPAPQTIAQPGIGRDVGPVLRQSVARIIANAETIRAQLAGPLAEEYSAYAADIASAGEHLLALLDDLATLEMVEAEDFSPAPDPIDLADLARRAAGILSMRARERGIVVDAPRHDETAPAIGEFRRVLQILLNLLGNAIRYSPEGSQIWLRAEAEDGRAKIVVADQGEGLTPDEQTRIFAKFERLGRSGDGGSGLGLYISRSLAEAMGGTLSVESAKGQGARFTLDLPADLSKLRE